MEERNIAARSELDSRHRAPPPPPDCEIIPIPNMWNLYLLAHPGNAHAKKESGLVK